MTAGQEILEELCRDLGLDADDTVLAIGSPAEVLCAEADERDADVIVVGARGHGPHRLNAGSVGMRLMNMANRTVTVVR
jgi:nucleotide-binding universal stress UspA family protein